MYQAVVSIRFFCDVTSVASSPFFARSGCHFYLDIIRTFTELLGMLALHSFLFLYFQLP